MSGYLVNFIVYTTAMVGIIFLAVFVYKKFSYCGVSKSKFLDLEDCINIAPRKSLYVVRAGNERFLIASDADRTSLISKLGDNQTIESVVNKGECNNKNSVDDLPSIVDISERKKTKRVFQNLVNNL